MSCQSRVGMRGAGPWVAALLVCGACGGKGGAGGDADAGVDPVADDPGSGDMLLDIGTEPEPDTIEDAADATTGDAPVDPGVPDVFDPDCPVDNPTWTVGLQFWREGAFEGYTLFAPIPSRFTYLIDMCGRVVHQWEGQYVPGTVVYLLDDGHLLRTEMLPPALNPVFNQGGQAGRVYEMDWDGNILWEFTYSSADHMSHHDVEPLPSGNVLMIAWEYKTRAEAEAVGRDPSLLRDGELWPDHVVEVDPDTATIVWEWHVWDHLIQDRFPSLPGYGVVADHPELVDVNRTLLGQMDWLHVNSVAYNAELDQIVLSAHNLSEIWVIDHSTTTGEAAGHTGGAHGKGGDLLYRWGNPQNYGAGGAADKVIHHQHDVHWIAPGLPGEGDILLFDNGRTFSTVVQIVPPANAVGDYPLLSGAWGPDIPKWTYSDPPDFFSSSISGAQRQPGASTLICEGNTGHIFEVAPGGEVVWSYISPVTVSGILHQGDPVPSTPTGTANSVFRAYRFGPDHPALAGKDLTPGDTIELP